jgi:predicted RND superfamily exporter protein
LPSGHLFVALQKTASELPATIEALQKSIQEMQASVVKLEQASDLLNVKIRTANSTQTSWTSIEQIRQDVQALKEAFLGRSQFPDPRSNVSAVDEVFL